MITSSFTKNFGSIKSSLHNEFSMTGLGLLKQFIGLNIEKYEARIKFKPKKLAYLLFNFKIDECKEAKFPFLSETKLGEFGASPLVGNSLYRQVVWSLLCSTHSQHDLEYDVHFDFIDTKNPHEIHWNVENRSLHYVQGTKHFGVHYVAGSPLELVGFTNSDWLEIPLIEIPLQAMYS